MKSLSIGGDVGAAVAPARQPACGGRRGSLRHGRRAGSSGGGGGRRRGSSGFGSRGCRGTGAGAGPVRQALRGCCCSCGRGCGGSACRRGRRRGRVRAHGWGLGRTGGWPRQACLRRLRGTQCGRSGRVTRPQSGEQRGPRGQPLLQQQLQASPQAAEAVRSIIHQRPDLPASARSRSAGRQPRCGLEGPRSQPAHRMQPVRWAQRSARRERVLDTGGAMCASAPSRRRSSGFSRVMPSGGIRGCCRRGGRSGLRSGGGCTCCRAFRRYLDRQV